MIKKRSPEAGGAVAAPLSAAGGAGRRRGCPGGGREAGAAFPRKTKGSGGGGDESGREGRRGSFPAARHWPVRLRGGRHGRGKGGGLREGRLRTGPRGIMCRAGGAEGPGAAAPRAGKEAKGFFGLYGGRLHPGTPHGRQLGTAFGVGREPCLRAGSPPVGSRWGRPSRDPATDTSLSRPPSSHPQVSRAPRLLPPCPAAASALSPAAITPGTMMPRPAAAAHLCWVGHSSPSRRPPAG